MTDDVKLPEPYARMPKIEADPENPYCAASVVMSSVDVYTADQVRAAVLAERDRCALIADAKAEGIARVNTYRGKVNHASQHAVDMVEAVAEAIRKG